LAWVISANSPLRRIDGSLAWQIAAYSTLPVAILARIDSVGPVVGVLSNHFAGDAWEDGTFGLIKLVPPPVRAAADHCAIALQIDVLAAPAIDSGPEVARAGLAQMHVAGHL
jgi:hypothetical protein